MLNPIYRFIRVLRRKCAQVISRLTNAEPNTRGLNSDGLALKATDFVGRFREIVSDPVNILIHRDPRAGVVDRGHVYLHNGNQVAASGAMAYYGRFSDILIINRGVHEPTEEFVFQQVLKKFRAAPVMLELGAYWGHYSMWLKRSFPDSAVYLVEPDGRNLAVGKHNFLINGYHGTFIQEFVGRGYFTVDDFLAKTGIPRLDVLHSDIQGFEMEMLEGAVKALRRQRIDYVFVSTHSNPLHYGVRDRLEQLGYVVEVSCDYEQETCSHDGLVFARAPAAAPVVPSMRTPGRVQSTQMEPAAILLALQQASHDL